MSLAETVRVKLSSEAADFISLTPVVMREMPVRELIEVVLATTGKDVVRVRQYLLRGSLVSGGTRFRWQGWDAAPDDIASLLATFPDPDPDRPFSPQHCVSAVLGGPSCRIEVTREAASAGRLFRSGNFWDELIGIASAGGGEYAGYSYSERADRYRFRLTPDAAARLRDRASALKYSVLESQIRRASIAWTEFLVARET
jgi:hypothetical protein